MLNKKGFFFTVGILLLIIPLIFLVTYYVTLDRTKTEDVLGKIRCDELHYFVEDVRKDLGRAAMISGRRAAVYAVNYVVSEGYPLNDYVFNCTPSCNVDCSDFNVYVNGSEAALTELSLCGTLFGVNATYMQNHTLSEWIQLISGESDNMNFNLSLNVDEVHAIPYDAFTFIMKVNASVKASDANGMCFFEKDGFIIQSNVSIDGLEDPLYALNTEGDLVKYITNCNISLYAENIVGSSDRGYGNGSGGGTVFIGTSVAPPDRGDYCSTHNVSGLVLVLPLGFGSCNLFEQMCYNISSAQGDHFEAVINYGPDDPTSFADKCDITIPWISDTGDLGLGVGDCTYIRNLPECGIHDVYGSFLSNETNATCYQASNISAFLYACGDMPTGPSFFDRLDGRLNLSEKYVNQSKTYFGNEYIGLESLVNLYELSSNGREVFDEATWVDYLYWQNVSGCESPGVCQVGVYPFRIDCPHAKFFRADTGCTNGTGVDPESMILYPAAGSTINCSLMPINVSGNASDCDGSLLSVGVFLGGLPWVNASLNGTLWYVEWNASLDGNYTLISLATDDDGYTSVPGHQVNVTVTGCGSGSPPGPSSCGDYCMALGNYSAGTCRSNAAQCTGSGEVYESGGDAYCPGGSLDDYCCCLPGSTTSTTLATTSTTTTTSPTTTTVATTSTTSTTTTSSTSTTTSPITTTTSTTTTTTSSTTTLTPDCESYCQSLSYSAGTCRNNPSQCTVNGEAYESGGDAYCTGGPSADTCCCLP